MAIDVAMIIFQESRMCVSSLDPSTSKDYGTNAQAHTECLIQVHKDRSFETYINVVPLKQVVLPYRASGT